MVLVKEVKTFGGSRVSLKVVAKLAQLGTRFGGMNFNIVL